MLKALAPSPMSMANFEYNNESESLLLFSIQLITGLIIFPAQEQQMFRGDRGEVAPGDVSSCEEVVVTALGLWFGPRERQPGSRVGRSPMMAKRLIRSNQLGPVQGFRVKQKGFISDGGEGRKERGGKK